MNELTTKANNQELTGLAVDAIAELRRACSKFPKFPDRLVIEDGMNTKIDRQLKLARICNDSPDGCAASAYSVFGEEFLEFIEAAQKGDEAGARKELVQAMAMLMRIYCHLDRYCADAKGKRG